jgi:CheY-like chemotaxis protein
LTSKYKSEFLANMSHELRTPLNSLLILSDQLTRNPDGNLSHRQTEFAKTIHASGKDLLALINDILDLSKIESGTVVVDVGELRVADLLDYVDRTFRHVAEARKLEFQIDTSRLMNRSLTTDAKRFQQVLKNLLSNAFKFTERGRVALRLETVTDGWTPGLKSLDNAESVVAISVADTGIGIPGDKQQIIFEAFQQADGSTSRKYGGTGLGLAISREIARLLGGEIRLQSVPGQGSTFTLYVPETYTAVPVLPRSQAIADSQSRIVSVMSDVDAAHSEAESSLEIRDVPDDRGAISESDRVLLIVENDENFARFLVDLAHDQGFKALVATKGADALALVQTHRRIDAITLDIQLPVIDGWRVLERLKNDLGTRHIPVYVITTEEETERAYPMGAIGTLQKPVKTREALEQVFVEIKSTLDRTEKDILVISPDDSTRAHIRDAVADGAIRVAELAELAEGLGALDAHAFDCVVLDPGRTAVRDFEAVAEILRQCSSRRIPVAVWMPEDGVLSDAEKERLERLARSGAIRSARSLDRLVDHTLLYLHRPVASLTSEHRARIEKLYETGQVLSGKKVLIVDDDIRNIFAMTSVLEREQMQVIAAETGKEAIEKLDQVRDVDIVLMDIMMPDMDGYDTMQAIRRIGMFKDLPIIAVTAKAMKGDREKTLQAGAWDYLAKPVDTDQMISVLRSWLCR